MQYGSSISETTIRLDGRPLQGCCDIGGPNAPSRAVIKFDDVALVVLLDAHTVRFRLRARTPVSRRGQRRQDRGSLIRLRVDAFVAPVNL